MRAAPSPPLIAPLSTWSYASLRATPPGKIIFFRAGYVERVRPAPPAALTDRGPVRRYNEDAWGWAALDDLTAVYVVADGLGGAAGSADAVSRMAADLICAEAGARLQVDPARSPEALEAALRGAILAANEGILAAFQHVGTTATVALVWAGRHAVIANVGDSRTYLFRDRALRQITTDHSLVARMIAMGHIQPAEARTHPHSNILLRTLGYGSDVEVDTFHLPLEAGDRLLLCTDGLWRELDDEELEATLRSCGGDPTLSCQELHRGALYNEPRDNLTVMVVAVGGGGVGRG